VIAIDGPAGAGKSTVSRALARDLGLRYLDTGAMYRALACKALREGVQPDDAEAAAALLERTRIDFGGRDGQAVILDGIDVSGAIRSPEVSEVASALSVHPAVRRGMVALQRALVERGGVILEGRDATTVIAPNADLKIYLTASLEERARRRHLEFEQKGVHEDYHRVRTDIENRDHRDITREDSPLSVAPGAHIIESGNLGVEEVIERIKALLP
jgi:CMP/dCMP kinase